MPIYSNIYSMNPCVSQQRRGGVSYCSAVMYPSSCGVHCTPATSTLPSSSEKDRPRFRPWMVTSVPPSRGPAIGLTFVERKLKSVVIQSPMKRTMVLRYKAKIVTASLTVYFIASAFSFSLLIFYRWIFLVQGSNIPEFPILENNVP